MHFDAAFRARLHDLFVWRRDVRRFRRDPVPQGTLDRLFKTACLAPSVGFSQPWRFVVVNDPARRAQVRASFENANAQALAGYEGERAALYAGLKLSGLDDAPEHFAVYADRSTLTGHGLGRRTMPETIDYSAVMAVHTLWLAARAEDLGLGWVSILDPARLNTILDVPAPWRLIGYFCLGLPETHHPTPELERAGWEQRQNLDDIVLQR